MRRREAEPDDFHAALLWIDIGAGVFLLALLLSAMLVPELRMLHSLQALIYVAVVVLAHRNSAWGYGAGFSVAILWNAMGLFVTHLIQAGAIGLWSWLRIGHAGELVPMTVTLGGMGHCILICASVVLMVRSNAERWKWWKFAGGGVLSLAYFAVLVALFEPH